MVDVLEGSQKSNPRPASKDASEQRGGLAAAGKGCSLLACLASSVSTTTITSSSSLSSHLPAPLTMSNNSRAGPSSPPRGKGAGGGGGWSWRARKEDVVVPRPGFSRRAEPTLYPQGGGSGGPSNVRVKPHVSEAMAALGGQRSPPAAGEHDGDSADVWTPDSRGGGASAYSGAGWGRPDYYGRGYGWGDRGHSSYAGRRTSSSGGGPSSDDRPRDAGWSSRGQRSDPSLASSPPRNRQRQHDIEEALRIDWPTIESRAKENGFVVPSDLVVEFKRQGHFDSLRRSLLQSFLSSSPQAKGEVVDSISDLLLGYIEGNLAEASKIMAMSGGDVRLMQAEMVKVVEMEEPVRGRVKRRKEEGEYLPPSGPQIQRDLLAKMREEGGDQKEDEERDAILSILSTSSTSSTSIARTIQERVEALLKEEEEKRGRMVDREGEEGRTPAVAAGATPSSGEATPATPAQQGKEAAGSGSGAGRQEESQQEKEQMEDVKPDEEAGKQSAADDNGAQEAVKEPPAEVKTDGEASHHSRQENGDQPTAAGSDAMQVDGGQGDESSLQAAEQRETEEVGGAGAGEEADTTVMAAKEEEVAAEETMEAEAAPLADFPLD